MSDAPVPKSAPLQRTRERTIEALCAHFAGDELTLAEFEERIDRAHRADSVEQLTALLADLPDTSAAAVAEPRTEAARRPAPPAVARRERQLVFSLMGGAARTGHWTPASSILVFAVMGGASLDFRDAALPAGTTEVMIFTLMGGAEIIVPPDLAVEVNGMAVMGGFDHLETTGAAPEPDAPRLRIGGFAFMGGVEVTVRLTGESAKDARRRARAEQKRKRML